MCVCVCSGTVQQKFRSVPEDDVVVDPHKKLSALRFLLNKKSFNSQHALLWCLTRMCTVSRKQLRLSNTHRSCRFIVCLCDVMQAVMLSLCAPSLTSQKLKQQVSTAAPCFLTHGSVAPTTNRWGPRVASCWTERPTTPTSKEVRVCLRCV